ncbi:MAG: hypothetical protein L0177_04420 [Chloroflexi bacterium]|nr:hypothetical protein [Chloroflexota bacterium]
MKVLGRDLIQPFGKFWEKFKIEIPIPLEYIEEGHSAAFGDQGFDATRPELPAWSFLPNDDLAYHVAHELAHIVLNQRGFPRTGRGKGYPPDSAEARVGGDLDEMIIHPPLERLLEPFGFKHDFILKRLFNGAMKGVSRSPVPPYGTPWAFSWAIRYCQLKMELPPLEWTLLEAVYRARAPQIVALGEELASIMRETGWGTREQALAAMVKVRDALGLKVDNRVLVIDPLSGQVL